MDATRVREVMNTAPVTVAPHASVESAGRRMRRQGVGSVIVAASDRVDGMVTRMDVADLVLANRDPATTTVREMMTAEPVTIAAEERVVEAAKLLQRIPQKRLPVTDATGLVGAITTRDVARSLLYDPQRTDDGRPLALDS